MSIFVVANIRFSDSQFKVLSTFLRRYLSKYNRHRSTFSLMPAAIRLPSSVLEGGVHATKKQIDHEKLI